MVTQRLQLAPDEVEITKQGIQERLIASGITVPDDKQPLFAKALNNAAMVTRTKIRNKYNDHFRPSENDYTTSALQLIGNLVENKTLSQDQLSIALDNLAPKTLVLTPNARVLVA